MTKDLKFTVSNELYSGFNELNQLFQVYKFYIESLSSKQKEESVEEFIESQMTILDSFCSSHLKKMKENLIKSTASWKTKKTEE